MKNVNPQYTFDQAGNPVGVFLSIEEWASIARHLQLQMPEWQKKLIDGRLEAYRRNPSELLDWDTITQEFDKEDEAI